MKNQRYQDTDERMGYIEGLNCIAADMEDGAYLAFMTENGVTLDELTDYAEYVNEKKEKTL